MKTMLAILFLFAVSDASAECCQCQCVTPNSPIDPPAVVTPVPVPPPVVPRPVVNSDPGGLWYPMAGRMIADQSGPTSAYLSSFVPGCLNGSYPLTSSGTGCGANAGFSTFAFGSGNVLGVRYMSKASAGKELKWFIFSSGDGGNVGQPMKVWLSQIPTATYDETSPACKMTAADTPLIITGPGYCPIQPNARYYVFMSVDTDFAQPTGRYKIDESAADFY